MKIFGKILKIVAALAAIAGAVYVAITYGDRIVAWIQDKLGIGCCCCDDCDCDCCCCDEDCELNEEDYFEVECPACGDTICFDSTIDPEELVCPACGEKFECLVSEEDLKALDEE